MGHVVMDQVIRADIGRIAGNLGREKERRSVNAGFLDPRSQDSFIAIRDRRIEKSVTRC